MRPYKPLTRILFFLTSKNVLYFSYVRSPRAGTASISMFIGTISKER